MLQQQPQQMHPKVTQVSGQKDNPIIVGTRSTARIASNATIPALRNILPKNAVVSVLINLFLYFSPYFFSSNA